jgi:hypothetical protein
VIDGIKSDARSVDVGVVAGVVALKTTKVGGGVRLAGKVEERDKII